MPAHDWTRVDDGIFHDFHLSWIFLLKELLNAKILPKPYYALAEQRAWDVVPDVIALELRPPNEPTAMRDAFGPDVAMAVLPPPKATVTAKMMRPSYPTMRRTIVIRHTSDHSVVALIEIVSRGNKARRKELEAFINKAQTALEQGIHLLIIDLYPPSRLDPQGIHGALMASCGEESIPMPKGKPLLAASYESSAEISAFVEPFGVGDRLPDSALFLRRAFHVAVPLEETYQQAWRSMPDFIKKKLEA